MKQLIGAAVTLLLCLTITGTASAYSYCGYWPGDEVYNVCLKETPDSCEGIWKEPFENTMARWNTAQSSPVLRVYTTPEDSIAPDNDRNEAGWLSLATVASRFGPISATALAANWSRWTCDCCELIESDITFHTDHDWTFNREATGGAGPYYFEEVASHELGHTAGFQHEDRYMTMMNSITHTDPSLYGYPHTDERVGLVDNTYFTTDSFRDQALLPYAVPTQTSTSLNGAWLSVANPAAPGDTITVGGFRVENWGTTLEGEDVTVSIVLSTNDIGSVSDRLLQEVYWTDVTSWGYLGSNPTATVPAVASGLYYVIAVLDIENVVDENYGWNNHWILGTVVVDADADNDGYDRPADCDDGDASVNPGASEVCNGRDDNCDGALGSGEVDGDGDGYLICEGDCADGDSTINPGASELCDLLDNDCDDLVDENCDDEMPPVDCATQPGGTSGSTWAGLLLGLAAVSVGRRRRRGVSGRAIAVFCLGVLGLMLSHGAAMATTIAPVDELGLVGISERVVLGTVTAVDEESWGPRAMPVTRVTVEVGEVWKGPQTKTVSFLQPGGHTADGQALRLSGAVEFVVGAQVLLFLERSPTGAMVVAGLHLGAMGIEGDRLEQLPGQTAAMAKHGASAGPREPAPLRPFEGWSLEKARRWVSINRDAPWPGHIPRPAHSAGVADEARGAGSSTEMMPAP